MTRADGSALFVCSTDIHVRMFAPVARVLDRKGWRSRFVSLDPLYHQAASAAAEALGLPILGVGPGRPVGKPFHRRFPIAVWWDLLRSRQPISAFLAHETPDAIVVGNDSGLIERAWLGAARQRTVQRSVLVQDGRIGPRVIPRGRGAAFMVRSRLTASRLLSSLGLEHLVTSDYGAGGTDVICASGPVSASLLRMRSRGRSEVRITGQPRYDGLYSTHESMLAVAVGPVVFFTTPYQQAGFGPKAQESQERLVASVAEALEMVGIHFLVKPHPRESAGRYRTLVGDAHVTSDPPQSLLRIARAAIVGFSTVIEEAAIVGCPVLVPSSGAVEEAAPTLASAHAYPRFRTVAEAVEICAGLGSVAASAAAVAAQRRWVQAEVEFGEFLAAERVADAITD